jgi:hypothetical protein
MKKGFLFLLSKEKTIAIIAIVLSWYAQYRDYLDYEKATQDIAGSDIDIYARHGLRIVFVLLGFVLFLICSSINYRFISRVAPIALLLPLGVFFSWYLTSYEVLHNPNAGELSKRNTLGLIDADWGHAILLCITLTLLVLEILKICFIPSQQKSHNSPSRSSEK